MTKLIGIRSLFESLLSPSGDFLGLLPSLKQQCLLFDNIGFLGLDDGKNPMVSTIIGKHRDQVEWLKENGLICNIDYPRNVANEEDKAEFLKYLSEIGMGDDYWEFFLPIIKKSYEGYETFTRKSRALRVKSLKEQSKLQGKLLQDISKKKVPKDDLVRFMNLIENFTQDANKLVEYLGNSQIKRETIIARFVSIKTMYFEKTDAVSLVPSYEFPKIPASRRSEVAKVTINKLPIPDETTSWEQIIDFRSDPDNQLALLRLRRWIRKIASENLSALEIEEELEWLLNEYENNLHLHKIKSNTSAVEIWVKSPLEVLENLVTLKFSKLVDPLFAIRKRRISLLEAELQAPGREVAYILKTKEHF
jgi:hypothetical protein